MKILTAPPVLTRFRITTVRPHLLALIGLALVADLPGQAVLPGTAPLVQADYSAEMAAGINRYFDRALVQSIEARERFWHPDFSSPSAYEESVASNREHLAWMIGAVEERTANADLEFVATSQAPAKVAETEAFTAYAVRWRVVGQVHGEGLLLQPKAPVLARVVAVPDADQTPEMLLGTAPGLPADRQYARRLAEQGCQVIIPTIVDRSTARSGSARLSRYTNQTHREWIYRQAYTFGRHIIGYEVLKILSAVDWFSRQDSTRPVPIGVVGWGEGALLAFHAAAFDTRIDAALISGYFTRRERVWDEPVYRNVFGSLREFGDAGIARLILPRTLIIEHAAAPQVDGPPPPVSAPGRSGASAAPGRIIGPSYRDVAAEFERARRLAGPFRSSLHLLHDQQRPKQALDSESLAAFLRELEPTAPALSPPGPAPTELRQAFDPVERQHRQVAAFEHHIQHLIDESRHVREDFLWNKVPVGTPDEWRESMRAYRKTFWNQINGRLPAGDVPINPRSRQIHDEPTWRGYEVTLDVRPDVFAWGYLLLPKDLRRGEKRPLVVAHHGGNGVPADLLDENNRTYNALAVRLVERGFIVFAPHFPWRADSAHRVIQRKANPLGLSLFSVIFTQHERMLDWLSASPWVDPSRIGFYGLSWGGKVAVRAPAVFEQYRVSVCSGDFNEWIWKNATTDWPNSYMFVPEYEMFDFNLGLTFGYAEMAAMIAPRAFMVERGHKDGVGTDEWVAFEYAKVNRLYDQLGIPDRTRIEYFNGGHAIRAVGTMEFLHRHLDWPKPASNP